MDKFDLTETVKFHIITTHLKPVIDKLGVALGQFAEQEVEASHSVFHKLWKQRFFVKYVDANDEVFKSQYLKAVLTFNRQNKKINETRCLLKCFLGECENHPITPFTLTLSRLIVIFEKCHYQEV